MAKNMAKDISNYKEQLLKYQFSLNYILYQCRDIELSKYLAYIYRVLLL